MLTSKLQHTHTFETEYESDETGHWYACTGCEEQGNFEAHVFDNPCDPDCNICGYITDTAHTADAQWSTDESGHWHICAVCGAEKAQEESGSSSSLGIVLIVLIVVAVLVAAAYAALLILMR